MAENLVYFGKSATRARRTSSGCWGRVPAVSVRSDGLPVWSSLPCSDFLPTCMSVSIRIVLDLQKHDKSGTERAHITQAGLALLTSCIGVFVTINEATLTRKICKSMLYSDCLNFYRNPLQMPHGTWLSRVPSLLLTEFPRRYCQVFCRVSFGWDLSCVFLTFTGL